MKFGHLPLAALFFFVSMPAAAQTSVLKFTPSGIDAAGTISTLSVHPTVKNLVLAGVDMKWIYRSENAGTNWSLVNNHIIETDSFQIADVEFSAIYPRRAYTLAGNRGKGGGSSRQRSDRRLFLKVI